MTRAKLRALHIGCVGAMERKKNSKDKVKVKPGERGGLQIKTNEAAKHQWLRCSSPSNAFSCHDEFASG